MKIRDLLLLQCCKSSQGLRGVYASPGRCLLHVNIFQDNRDANYVICAEQTKISYHMDNQNYNIIDKLDTYMNRPISLSSATQRTPFMKLLLVNRKLIKVNYIIFTISTIFIASFYSLFSLLSTAKSYYISCCNSPISPQGPIKVPAYLNLTLNINLHSIRGWECNWLH